MNHAVRKADFCGNAHDSGPAATTDVPAKTSRILGTILLDVHGAVRRCSDAIAELVQRVPDELFGHAVKALLPALPLQSETVGYNIAYASFHSHARRPLPMRIAAGGGDMVPVRAWMRVVKHEREFQFLLQLERIEDGSGAHGSPF